MNRQSPNKPSPARSPTPSRQPARRLNQFRHHGPIDYQRVQPGDRFGAVEHHERTPCSRRHLQGSATLFFSHDVDHQRLMQQAPEGTTLYFDAFGVHAEMSARPLGDLARLCQRRRRHARRARAAFRPNRHHALLPHALEKPPAAPCRAAPTPFGFVTPLRNAGQPFPGSRHSRGGVKVSSTTRALGTGRKCVIARAATPKPMINR
jgi:hypothetical protein